MYRIVLAALIVIGIGVYLYMPSEEKRIKGLIQEIAVLAERRDVEGIMKYVSFNYRDQYGFTYISVKRTLQGILQDSDSVRVHIDSIEPSVEKKKARVRVVLKAEVTEAQEHWYLIGTEEVAETVYVSMEKETLGWRITEVYFPMREGLM